MLDIRYTKRIIKILHIHSVQFTLQYTVVVTSPSFLGPVLINLCPVTFLHLKTTVFEFNYSILVPVRTI